MIPPPATDISESGMYNPLASFRLPVEGGNCVPERPLQMIRVFGERTSESCDCVQMEQMDGMMITLLRLMLRTSPRLVRWTTLGLADMTVY